MSKHITHGYFTPYRLDRKPNGREISLYVREDIPSKILEKPAF